MKIFRSAFLLLLSTLLSISISHAATFQPTITAVGQDSITVLTGLHGGLKVKIDGKTQTPSNVKTYRVVPSTTITIDGLPGTLAQLKKDMAVLVVEGIDQGTAESIVANNIGKPLPTPVPTSKNKKAPKDQVIGALRVLAVTPTTITVATPGSKASAYLVTPDTKVIINGVVGQFHQVVVGMSVIVASDGQTATRISAQDAQENR
jgi:hypothetical protein